MRQLNTEGPQASSLPSEIGWAAPESPFLLGGCTLDFGGIELRQNRAEPLPILPIRAVPSEWDGHSRCSGRRASSVDAALRRTLLEQPEQTRRRSQIKLVQQAIRHDRDFRFSHVDDVCPRN